MNGGSPILYVEDEETDVLLMRLALKRSGLPNPLRVAVNGLEAINYLTGVGSFADRSQHPLPCLVLLDLNMPIMNGFEVLAWIRKQPQFTDLPVIVYTSSGGVNDRARATEFHATDYAVKKSHVGEIAEWLRGIGHFCESKPTPA
jgi:CheY-like chemotaxis protein